MKFTNSYLKVQIKSFGSCVHLQQRQTLNSSEEEKIKQMNFFFFFFAQKTVYIMSNTPLYTGLCYVLHLSLTLLQSNAKPLFRVERMQCVVAYCWESSFIFKMEYSYLLQYLQRFFFCPCFMSFEAKLHLKIA